MSVNFLPSETSLTKFLGSRCAYQFCWICSVAYSDILREGNNRHEESCTHYFAAPRQEEFEAELCRLREEEDRAVERLRLRLHDGEMSA